MLEKNNITQLLQNVSSIYKKYDDIAEATGEKFNVFEILNVNHYENTHSTILNYFLNSKGNHGQKDLFLKLFIEVVNSKFLDEKIEPSLTENSNFHNLKKFETNESESHTEIATGRIDENYENGGRIDILIKDKFNNNVIIENKIYAVDQEKQLVRYNNFNKNAPIFYLNLYNDSPSDDSKGNLIENKDYFIISYETEIIRWLEKCVKECANKPFIRETLNQYLNLIKELTNQSTNKIMEKEIVNILTRDFRAFTQIIDNLEAVFDEIIENLKQQLVTLSKKLELQLEFSIDDKQYAWFYLTNEKMRSKNNLAISFEFEENKYKQMKFGLTSTIKEEEEKKFDLDNLKNKFQSKFNQLKSDGNWLAYLPFDEYSNWNDNSYKAFEDILNGNFIKSVEEKTLKMIEIVNEL